MTKSAVFVASGILIFCGLGTGQNKQTQLPDSTRLIDSIQGPNLYKAYCAVWHGVNAKGDGPMAKSLKTTPSDLTRISSRNGGTFPLAKIRRIISGEEPLAVGHGTHEMPVWGPLFSQVAWDR